MLFQKNLKMVTIAIFVGKFVIHYFVSEFSGVRDTLKMRCFSFTFDISSISRYCDILFKQAQRPWQGCETLTVCLQEVCLENQIQPLSPEKFLG